MKKIFCVAVVLLLPVFILASCATQTLSIEDYGWKLRTVMSGDIETVQNEDSLVVAVGEQDEVYPDAKIVDITMSAKNGLITLIDSTNNKTYSGTYTVQNKTPQGTVYEVVINGIKGYASAEPTKYYGGSEVPTLPIILGEYALYFVPVN